MIEWWSTDLVAWQRIAGAVALAALGSYAVAELAARLARVWLVRAIRIG